jgi:hypothetical protein
MEASVRIARAGRCRRFRSMTRGAL